MALRMKNKHLHGNTIEAESLSLSSFWYSVQWLIQSHVEKSIKIVLYLKTPVRLNGLLKRSLSLMHREQVKITGIVWKWISRYIKFSLIGTLTWVIGTVLYFWLFKYFGELTWLVTLFTGVIEFGLITVFNKKKKGKMFDSCTDVREAAPVERKT